MVKDTLLILCIVLMYAFWIIAGNTGRFNDPEAFYIGRNSAGEMITSKGCRVERLMPDGSCDFSFQFKWKEFFEIDK
jgi:hypothetical protein